MEHIQRTLLKVAAKGPAKRLMMGTMKQQADASRAAQRFAIRQQRQQLFAQTSTPAWADWLMQQAHAGNVASLDVLRSREERDRRLQGDLLTAQRADKAKAVILERLKPQARKDGTMAYRTMDGGMVIDRKIHIQAQKATTGAVLVALELASRKFSGQALVVEGAEAFRQEVAQLAGLHGLNVCFNDLAMEKARQTAAEKAETMIVKGAQPVRTETEQVKANKAQVQPDQALTKWIEERNKKRDKISSIYYHRMWSSADAGKAVYQGRRLNNGIEVLLLKRGNEMLVKPSSSRVIAKAAQWKIGRVVQLDARGRFVEMSREAEL